METQCTMSCSCCCAQWSFMDEVITSVKGILSSKAARWIGNEM